MSSGWTSARAIPLPEELLTHIFDLATHNPARDIDALVGLQSFEKDYSSDVDLLCDVPLATKRAIVLTCSQFRRLVAKFLYEDIRIRYGSDGLVEALERQPELGILVKRVSISAEGFKAAGNWIASYPSGTRHILERCPNTIILTRPQNLPVDTEDSQDEFSALIPPTGDINLDDIHLPHLRRVDWFNSPIDTLPSTLPTPKFIWKSSSLQTLTIGPDHFPLQLNRSSIVELPSLRTIRLRSIHTPGNAEDGTINPESVQLPALRKLVFSLPDGVYTLFFEQFLRSCGPRIEEIEIASNERFLKHDYISILLLNCSNATKLSFPVFTTKPTRKNTRRQAIEVVYLITQIGLSAAGFRGEEEYDCDEDSQWERLACHFLAILGSRSRFSKLRKLILYGEEWKWVISDSRCKGSLRLLKSKDMELECEHESVASMLKTALEDS